MKGSFVAATAFALVVAGAAWMFRYDAKDSGYGTLLVTDSLDGERLPLCVVVSQKISGWMRQEVLAKAAWAFS